jgi:hypothetical protein
VLRPEGRLFVLCFSTKEPGTVGTRRISKDELNQAFTNGWTIELIKPSTFENNPNFKGAEFSPGGPKTWFMVARRA